jgi:serine/threonine protein kinase
LKYVFTGIEGKPVLDLLERLLDYNPERRITAAEALNHEFFSFTGVHVNPKTFKTVKY